MATPPDFSVGQVLTSATMNQVGLWKIRPATVSAGATIASNGSVTFTSQSSVSLNGVFTSSFNNYKIIYSDIVVSANNDLHMRLRVGGTDTAGAAYGYAYFQWDTAASASPQGFGVNGTDRMYIGRSFTTQGASFVEIASPAVAVPTIATFDNGAYLSGNRIVMRKGFNSQSGSTAFDGFTIFPAGGNISGAISVYGFNS
jgi:hypothetical protein